MAEHGEAVASGYIGRVKINDVIMWEVSPVGEDFLRQLRGDFQPRFGGAGAYAFTPPADGIMSYGTNIRKLLSDNSMEDIEEEYDSKFEALTGKLQSKGEK